MFRQNPHATASPRKAFTIIELLVVISVISVLLAITLPALSNAREAAKKTLCASQLHQSGITLSQYADANKDWYPGYGSHREFHIITGFNYADPMWQYLQELGWNFKALTCPSSAFKAHFDGSDTTLVLSYFYAGGYGDRLDASNKWYGYRYTNPTDAVTNRPIPRRNMTNLPYDTPLMSDIVRGSTTPSSTTPGVYARYSDINGSLHNYIAPNHFTGNDPLMRSTGGNFMAVDLAVTWKPYEALAYRYYRQYQYLYW